MIRAASFSSVIMVKVCGVFGVSSVVISRPIMMVPVARRIIGFVWLGPVSIVGVSGG